MKNSARVFFIINKIKIKITNKKIADNDNETDSDEAETAILLNEK